MTLPLLLLATMAAPVALAPTGKWTVDYAANLCALSRAYDTGTDQVALGLSPLPMSDSSDVVLLTHAKGAVAERGDVTVTLLPGGRPATGTYQRYPLAHGEGRLAKMFFTGEALAGLDKASAVEVRLGSESYTFAVPGIAGALTALSACQDDLLKGWGIDPGERQLDGPHTRGSPASFFGPSEYPPAAIRAGAQGRAVTVAAIDAGGAVTGCRVVVSSGPDAANKFLDTATCDIVRRKIRFTPARDQAGKAAPSHYILPVRWVLPDR